MSLAGSTAPKIVKNLKGTIAEKGTDVIFEAGIEGSPFPKCTWIKDNQQVWPQANKFSITSGNGKSTLVIHRATLQDSGNYKVEIANIAGSAWTSAELKVK
uniref:Titin n=1 Tax=Cacopsylla melanoneura TaxID=428564 RepID=A0A8D9FCB0_9HEMI